GGFVAAALGEQRPVPFPSRVADAEVDGDPLAFHVQLIPRVEIAATQERDPRGGSSARAVGQYVQLGVFQRPAIGESSFSRPPADGDAPVAERLPENGLPLRIDRRVLRTTPPSRL